MNRKYAHRKILLHNIPNQLKYRLFIVHVGVKGTGFPLHPLDLPPKGKWINDLIVVRSQHNEKIPSCT